MLHFNPTFLHVISIFTGYLSLSRKGKKLLPPRMLLYAQHIILSGLPSILRHNCAHEEYTRQVEFHNIILHPQIAKNGPCRSCLGGFLLLASITSKQTVNIFSNWPLRGVNVEQITEVVFTLSQKHCPTAGRLEHLKRLPFLFLFFIITTDERQHANGL